MNPMRKKEIARTILETLNHARGYAVPEASLRPQVDGLLRPPVTDEEWAQATYTLENPLGSWAITRVPSELDDSLIQWAITERGRVLLATL